MWKIEKNCLDRPQTRCVKWHLHTHTPQLRKVWIFQTSSGRGSLGAFTLHPFSLFGLTGPGDQIYKGHVGNNKRQEHTDGGVSQKNSHSYQQKFDEMKSEKLSTKRFCTSSRCVHTQGTRADKGQAGTKTPILRVCLPEVMPMKKRNCKDWIGCDEKALQ